MRNHQQEKNGSVSAIGENKPRRSKCPIANTLDILGDKWTLLIIRDLIMGKSKFVEFAASAERIPTNILSDRLKRLENQGIIESQFYSEHPPRLKYELTRKGKELGPVLKALVAWGVKNIPGTEAPDLPQLRA